MLGQLVFSPIELTSAQQAAADLLPCDGAAIPAAYSGLAAWLGSSNTPDYRGLFLRAQTSGAIETGDGLITADMLPAIADDGNTDETLTGGERTVAAKAGGGETIYSTESGLLPQQPVKPPFSDVYVYIQAS